MSIYYVTIFIFVILGYFYDRLADETVNNDRTKLITIVIFVFCIVYGFRFEVGVDWFNYIKIYERQVSDIYTLDTFELGYKLLNIISYYVDEGIVTVIFLSTVLFISFTLFALKKIELNPFYFFAIVAPYHLVMSGINYTRQGVALSIFLYAISCLINQEKKRFLFFILFAGLFHTSALAFLPLFLIGNKKRYLFILLLIVVPPIVFSMLNQYQQYLDSTIDSTGLYLRSLYLVAPSILLLLHFRGMQESSMVEKRLTYIVIFSFPLILVLSILSSTIADRFAYYFILLNTACWMLVSKRDGNIYIGYLKPYGNLLLFCSSLLAFIVWTLYTKYISSYQFDSYFNYWLS